MLVVLAAVVLVCVLAGPFQTHLLSLPSRILFWGVLIGLNGLKWWAWYRFAVPIGARRLGDGRRAALLMAALGAVLLNLTLPLEIGWMYQAVGQPVELAWLGLFLMAALMSLAISAVVWVLRPAERALVPEAPPPLPTGLASRTSLAGLLAVIAEDHYVRLHRADGQRPLVLYRFGDALAELAALDGEQVHRGAWVAAGAVASARRDGRRWLLVLTDATEVPVSDRYLASVRARGWLRVSG